MQPSGTLAAEADGAGAFGPAWRAAAADYVRYAGRIGFYDDAADRLARLVPAGCRVLLDFGCGDGRFARRLLRRRPALAAGLRELVLVDVAPEMLAFTRDLAPAGARVRRVVDDEGLARLPADLPGRVEVIAANSALHLLRDAAYRLRVPAFLARCRAVLAPGGSVIASIPDQDFDFGDGWESRFYRHARRLAPDRPARAGLERLDRPMLADLAGALGYALHLEEIALELRWSDFVDFYRVPAMGSCRMGEGGQAERLAALDRLEPWFERETYRWALLRLERTDGRA